ISFRHIWNPTQMALGNHLLRDGYFFSSYLESHVNGPMAIIYLGMDISFRHIWNPTQMALGNHLHSDGYFFTL
ncbi:MAG: hypothetical protein Q4C18_04450, partial [Eubacteriales bacterium]|nr:hypothetical protein [Eubacteriales bacterium]